MTLPVDAEHRFWKRDSKRADRQKPEGGDCWHCLFSVFSGRQADRGRDVSSLPFDDAADLLADDANDAVIFVVGSSAQFNPELAVEPLVNFAGTDKPFAVALTPAAEKSLALLTAAGVHVRKADRPDEVAEMVAASAALAFDSQIPVAVLFSQRLIGAKVFVK